MQSQPAAAVCAAIALMTGGLAACGDDEPTEPTTTASPIPANTDSSTSSPSSTSSTSGGSPTSDGVAPLPAAATKRTKEGAIAFNEFYWNQTGEALHSGDPSTMEAYSDGCPVCDTVASGVTKDAQKGIHMNKNPYSTTNASGRKRSDSGYRVELTVKIASYSEVLKDGSRGRTAEAGSFTTVSNTQWKEGHWVIKDAVRTK